MSEIFKSIFNKIVKPYRIPSTVSPSTEIIGHIDLQNRPYYDVTACNSQGRILRIMTIADCHGSFREDEIDFTRFFPDVVCFLGDNGYEDLEAALQTISAKSKVYNSASPFILGITGNHDQKELLKEFSDINRIHGGICSVGSVRIGGFSGSVKYKPDDYHCMFTHEESEAILSKLPSCDILITHDKPCFDAKPDNNAHSGLTGIGKYIKERKPALVLHGHLHERYIEQFDGTIIRCCHRIESFIVNL